MALSKATILFTNCLRAYLLKNSLSLDLGNDWFFK